MVGADHNGTRILGHTVGEPAAYVQAFRR